MTITTGTTFTTSNVAATFQSGETGLDNSDPDSRRTVWYKWTPSTPGTFTVSTAGSNFDTLLGVYVAGGGSSFSSLINVRHGVVGHCCGVMSTAEPWYAL